MPRLSFGCALVAAAAVLLDVTPATAATARILALGDSLTAGYGLPAADAFPVKLQKALGQAGYRIEVVNAGVSGDTTADGLARLDWVLGDPGGVPGYAIVELGANDALRGLDPKQAYANLDAILGKLRDRHVKVLLAGMYGPRNLGRDYDREFEAIYTRLQRKYGVPLYPFFLDGVALHPDLLQQDGLHPTAQGVDVIVRDILPAVERLLGPPDAAGG